MIQSVGTDIVKLARIEAAIQNYGDKFLSRCFTAAERARADGRGNRIGAYARLFAAKEALLKALGTGMREGLSWQDWEILPDEKGAPKVTVTGGALAHLGGKAPIIHLSMSDDGAYAVAFAIFSL